MDFQTAAKALGHLEQGPGFGLQLVSFVLGDVGPLHLRKLSKVVDGQVG